MSSLDNHYLVQRRRACHCGPLLPSNQRGLAQAERLGIVNAVFTATLTPVSGRTVTVAFTTAAGSAAADTDYVTTSGTLTFAAGVTTQTVTVPVIGDQVNESAEQFSVNLSGATNASIADAAGSGTIANDDPVPSISIADMSVTEGNSGTKTAAFTLTLSSASGQTVTVSYATANGLLIIVPGVLSGEPRMMRTGAVSPDAPSG